MRKEEIDILLKRYYEGTSTDEEEKSLKAFFSGSKIPAGYEAEKAMFEYYSSLSLAPSEGFEDRIIASLDTIAKKETVLWEKGVLRFAGIAASVLILTASWFFFNRDKQEDTFDDPEIAYVETMKILFDVSTKMNSGTAGLQPVSKINLKNIEGLEVLAKSKETLERNLMNLNQPEATAGKKSSSGEIEKKEK